MSLHFFRWNMFSFNEKWTQINFWSIELQENEWIKDKIVWTETTALPNELFSQDARQFWEMI